MREIMSPDPESRLVRLEERYAGIMDQVRMLAAMPLQVGGVKHDVDELRGRMERGFAHLEKDFEEVRAEQRDVRRELVARDEAAKARISALHDSIYQQRREDVEARDARDRMEAERRRTDFRWRYGAAIALLAIILTMVSLLITTIGVT